MTVAPALQERRASRNEPTPQPPIRLLIVDDSSVARAVLSRMSASQPDLQVAATAGSPAEALDALRSVCVDIVLLDVEMPGGNGLEALPDILRLGRGARVMVVSSLAEEGAEATVRALALGAADTLPKPGTGMFGGRFSQILAERLRRIGRAPRDACDDPAPAVPPLRLRDAPDGPPTCIAIGASTGGIHAINEFLSQLPTRLHAPILVTQHLPALFMPHFARQIAAASGREARVVEDGERIEPETIYVAPGFAHFLVDQRADVVRARLGTEPAPSGCLPSVDPMLRSVAATYGRGAVAVVLSGMGRDGAVGSEEIARAGGTVLAQDRFSCAIWGMPRAVAEAGLASAVLPPRDLARRIAARIGMKPWK